MTAPLVIAHWQVGEVLRRAGAPLGVGERAAVYLTNALTGWRAGEAAPELPGFEALAAERDAARAVKRDRPILVVLGNPPYNAYAGVSPREEGGLVEVYKAGLQDVWGVKKFMLDDLFVRFFRVAERRIAEGTGRGVVAYITNYAWLFMPSFTVMRERLLSSFDAAWIDCLNGDSRETGKVTPDGAPDPSVFSTPMNREGIRVGTAVATLIRRDGDDARNATARYRTFWGATKRTDLLATLDDAADGYTLLAPTRTNRYLLRSYGAVAAGYETWPAAPDLARVPPLPGLLEKRGGGLIGFDREDVVERMRGYLDPALSFAQAALANPALAVDRAGYTARKARERALESEGFNPNLVVRYCFYAFDARWAYVSDVPTLWNRDRPQLVHTAPDATGFLALRPQQIADPEGFPGLWTTCLADDHALHKDAFLVPVMENLSGAPRPNLSPAAQGYLAALGLAPDAAGAALVWHHALATLYSPAYLEENAASLRQGWPRLPLPDNPDALRRSAALGQALAALLDPDTPVAGVTRGDVRPELRAIAVPTTRPGHARDFALNAGWGSRTAKGVTAPGRGTLTRRSLAAAEAAAGAEAATLGALACDVDLNAATFWRGVPEKVWECRIGGYQVLKKWLSYREATTIDRPLTAAEVGHFQASARRIAAILLLGPELDEVYRDCVASHRPVTA